MRTTDRVLINKIIIYFMIVIMGMLIENTAVFLHVHKLDDGTIIQHAHPYNKTNDSGPYKSHHHTNTAFLFFQNLGLLFLVAFLTYALIVFVKPVKYLYRIIPKNISAYIITYKGRAPPVL
ncbi:MAG: hypothetical protein J7K39_01535 [Bacteroidales bacterium]|nr:hypothetical protein [Bacteroidales bacterium]